MNTTQSDSLQASVETAQPRGMARRNFVRGVGVMIPAVLTVTSRSAMANVCQSPSATASINLTNSRTDRTDGECFAGKSPGYWKNASETHPDKWTDSEADGVLFSVCFGSGFANMTLKEVMNLGGGDPYELGAHLSAAWCNLQMAWVTVLTLDQLKAMWAGQDNYSPMAGVVWTRAKTVDYLKTTMWS